MYTRRAALASLGAYLLLETAAESEPLSSEREAERDRAEYSKEILGSTGPLTGIAFFRIPDGRGVSTIGSDSSCACVVPSSNGPAHLGELTVSGGKADLHFAPGVKATVKGISVNEISVSDKDSRMISAKVGELTVMLRYEPAKLQALLRIWDARVVKAKKFPDLKWFNYNPSYRIVADWVPFGAPKTVRLPDSNGESREWKSPGSAEFDVQGRRVRLTPIEEPNPETPLFFVFGDSTNGRQTYGGGRFLYAAAPNADRVVLEFNMAVNPMCAYNHRFFVCPSPHRDSRLEVPIPAGKQVYPSPVDQGWCALIVGFRSVALKRGMTCKLRGTRHGFSDPRGFQVVPGPRAIHQLNP